MGCLDRRRHAASRNCLAVLALLACAWPAASRTSIRPRFTHLSTAQGLSQDIVQAVLEDHVGFLWFGTEEGLNRFDGYSFVLFKYDPQAADSLPDDVVSLLYEDQSGQLWVGTRSGLCRFDRSTGTFVRVPAIRERVTGIVERADGSMWVGTDGEGLFVRRPGSASFVLQQKEEGMPAGIRSRAVRALLRDRDDRLWVGTRDAGLFRLEEDGQRFRQWRQDPADPGSLTYDEISSLAEDPAGNLWVATYGGGLSVRDRVTGAFRRYQQGDGGGLASNLITCVFADPAGTVWVGTDGAGVQRFEPTSGRFTSLLHDPSDPGSLSKNVVRGLSSDSQGRLWVGTAFGGADRLEPASEVFTSYGHDPADPRSLGDPRVISFLEDAQQRLWVGTERGFLHRFERALGTFTSFRVPSAVAGGPAVLALLQDRRGRIWVGTYRSGLQEFHPQSGRFSPIPTHPDDPLGTGNEVWALAEESDGSLWLGTNAGLERFDPERRVVTERHETPNAEGLAHSEVRALLHDSHGNLWVATLGGLKLRLLGGGGFVNYRHDAQDPQGLSHNSVITLFEDRRSHIWIGTQGGGVDRLDPETRTFTHYLGLPSSTVYRIEQEPASARLWVSTNRGLARIDPDNGQIETFGATNGLPGEQFRLGASLRTRDGHLLFGGEGGFSEFDPADVRRDRFEPRVVLTALRVSGAPPRTTGLQSLEEISVPHDGVALCLEFAALDRLIPRRNQYAYRLGGVDEEWVPLGTRREVTLTNLEPGRYLFEAKASNSDGLWGEHSVVALRILVPPPFWRTAWFRALGGLGFVLALLGLHRLRVRQLTADLAARTRTEAALRLAEERYRGIFEHAVEGIFQATPAGRPLTVNPALARLLGYATPEDLIADTPDLAKRFRVDPVQLAAFTSHLREDGRLQGLTMSARARDGRPLYLSVNARAVGDTDGRTLYYEGTVLDLTGRLRAEQAEADLLGELQSLAAEWGLGFEAMEAPALILDASGHVLRINPAARRALGRNEEETLVGRPVVDLGPGQPWREVSDLAARVRTTAAASHTQVRDRRSGRVWKITASPLGAGPGDERVNVVVRDVTVRRAS